MPGRTHRKLTVIRLAGYHTGMSCVAPISYQFPQIVDNPLKAGIDPRLRATRPHPGLPTRSGNGAAAASLLLASRTAGGVPSAPTASSPVPLRRARCRRRALAGGLLLHPSPCAPAADPPPGKPDCGRQILADAGQPLGELQGSQFFTLRAIRRCARSCCATAPPSRGAGRRPPARGCPLMARGSGGRA